jgi:hypothetical protein
LGAGRPSVATMPEFLDRFVTVLTILRGEGTL